MPLPEQPHPAGQRPADNPLADSVIQAAVRDTLHRARYDNPDLPSYEDGPQIGTAPPVPQPGRAAMSQKGVDDTARMLGASAFIGTAGGATALVLWASEHADPVVVGLLAGGPVALVLAIGRLVRRAQPAPDVHHHYEGPVHQDQRQTHNRTNGVWAHTTNKA